MVDIQQAHTHGKGSLPFDWTAFGITYMGIFLFYFSIQLLNYIFTKVIPILNEPWLLLVIVFVLILLTFGMEVGTPSTVQGGERVIDQAVAQRRADAVAGLATTASSILPEEIAAFF